MEVTTPQFSALCCHVTACNGDKIKHSINVLPNVRKYTGLTLSVYVHVDVDMYM